MKQQKHEDKTKWLERAITTVPNIAHPTIVNVFKYFFIIFYYLQIKTVVSKAKRFGDVVSAQLEHL